MFLLSKWKDSGYLVCATSMAGDINSLNLLVVSANSVDPDEMPLYVAFHQGLHCLPKGHIGQLVTCLATDASLTADPGVTSSIPARSHTFVEIDYEIISTLNLLPSAELFKKGCCQLQAKVCARSTNWLIACSSLPRKKVWLGELIVPPWP